MLWFVIGMIVGGVLGMIMLALMVAAKQGDEHLGSDVNSPYCVETIKQEGDDDNA